MNGKNNSENHLILQILIQKFAVFATYLRILVSIKQLFGTLVKAIL